MKFIAACKRFFNQKPSQTLGEFVKEVKTLTPEDKQELKPLLEKELGGNDIIEDV